VNNAAALMLIPLRLGPSAYFGCDRDPSTRLLKGQANAAMTFYGMSVDQNGNPLPGVTFEFIIDSIPKDWTFETRGKPNDRITHKAVSGRDGRFKLEVTAHRLFINEAKLPGYRHLTAEFSDDGNTGYMITASGDLWHRFDPNNPAIYVFVMDGTTEVSALPSRGGFDSGGGTQWVANQPSWPKKPSLRDVVYKPPTTQPATTRW